MKTVRWFALLITATVPVSTALFPAAAATPSENADAVIVSQATVDGVDYITREITIQPGGSTGWHGHQGEIYGVIKAGTLTHYSRDCTQDGVYTVGDPITDPTGLDHVHLARNLGAVPVVLEVTYVDPAGAPTADSLPNPGCDFE